MTEAILLVLGVVLGFAASQGNEWLRLWREEKRAIGRALKTLLYVRDYLYGIKRTKEIIKEHYNLPSQALVQFQLFMQAFIMPNAAVLLGRYEEAIDVVSGVKPLLGLRLAKQTELLPTLMRMTMIAGMNEQGSTAWLALESHISDPSTLDDLILELAELHSIDIRPEVRRKLEEPPAIPPDLENFLKESAKAIQKPDAPQQ